MNEEQAAEQLRTDPGKIGPLGDGPEVTYIGPPVEVDLSGAFHLTDRAAATMIQSATPIVQAIADKLVESDDPIGEAARLLDVFRGFSDGMARIADATAQFAAAMERAASAATIAAVAFASGTGGGDLIQRATIGAADMRARDVPKDPTADDVLGADHPDIRCDNPECLNCFVPCECVTVGLPADDPHCRICNDTQRVRRPLRWVDFPNIPPNQRFRFVGSAGYPESL